MVRPRNTRPKTDPQDMQTQAVQPTFPDLFTPKALCAWIGELRTETAGAATEAFTERLYSVLSHRDLIVTVDTDETDMNRRLAAGEPAFEPGTPMNDTLIVMVFGFREARRLFLSGCRPGTAEPMDAQATRDFYAGHFAGLADHWEQTAPTPEAQRDGVVLSFLNLLDGTGSHLPALNLTHSVTGATLPHTLKRTWSGESPD